MQPNTEGSGAKNASAISATAPPHPNARGLMKPHCRRTVPCTTRRRAGGRASRVSEATERGKDGGAIRVDTKEQRRSSGAFGGGLRAP